MRAEIMNNRRTAVRVVLAAALSCVIVLYLCFSLPMSTSDSILNALGGAMLSRKMNARSLIISLFPIFILCFLLADYLQSDFAACCVYIFTRARSRFGYTAKRIPALLGWISIFYLLLFIVVLFSLPARGFALTASLVRESLLVLTFDVLSAFMLLLPLNLLAVKLGSVRAFLICFGLYLGFLLTGIFSPPAVSMTLPFSQGNYAWHQPMWFASSPKESVCAIPGFSLAYSLVYMTVTIWIEIFISVLAINRLDLLSMPEGEN